MLEKGRSLAGDVPNILGALGQAHALAGETQKAREILHGLRTAARECPVPLTCIAIVHLGLGKRIWRSTHRERRANAARPV